jgi:heme-degrading monooxygenase HmoA
MILEIAEIDVKAGQEAEFESAVGRALPLFHAAPGCRGVRLQRGVEQSNRYWLFVRWETFEDHTVGFRGSEAFTRWRALVSPHFEAPPRVQHARPVLGDAPPRVR